METYKTALITGASSGFGKATAIKLAANGYNVIITGRRENYLRRLEEVIRSNSGVDVLTLHFDVRKSDEVENSIDSLPEKMRNIDVLVNNAGLAVGLNPVQGGLLDDWERMIDTNIKGLLYITRKVVPLMVSRGSGHIINIGSVAGKEVYPEGNVYCATKSAVDALSKGMRLDLVKHGIKVTVIHPGMAETEFSLVRFKGDAVAASKVYYGLTPLNAEDVADAVLFAVTRPAHVNINEMIIMPAAQASATVVHRKE
jgi:NADP-dependent 3-hydroxy acid dehydrogenase YdfG